MTAETCLPPRAYALALADLPGIGPATLSALLAGSPPAEAWEAVRDGRVTRPVRRRRPGPTHEQLGFGDGLDTGGPSSWQEVARRRDVGLRWRQSLESAIGVTWRGDERFPTALTEDPEPPGVLFWRGRLDALAAPCVAVVGTRHATPDGRQVAYELGRDLARGGVCVVSGLALGIDAAAHRGALAAGTAPTVGVAASGVDVAYPRRHVELWEEVVAAGAIVSETPPGRPAQAWRFPARNRIIAALVRMVVVVESHQAGGSMLTVDAALRRGVEVGAVPGSVHSPASLGTNRLLFDGAAPVRSATDVLEAVGISTPGAADSPAANRGAAASASPHGDRLRVLEAVGWAPTALARVTERAGIEVAATVEALDWLEERGWVEAQGPWWVRRR